MRGKESGVIEVPHRATSLSGPPMSRRCSWCYIVARTWLNEYNIFTNARNMQRPVVWWSAALKCCHRLKLALKQGGYSCNDVRLIYSQLNNLDASNDHTKDVNCMPVFLSVLACLLSVLACLLSVVGLSSVCVGLSSVCVGLSSVCVGLSSVCVGLSSVCSWLVLNRFWFQVRALLLIYLFFCSVPFENCYVTTCIQLTDDFP